MKLKHKPKIVVIGGGTGSFMLLQTLKRHTEDLTALVNMADDGGSSGALRDELGVLPPGDVRQCLVALSESPKLRELFNYRFTDGKLAGHSLGNLFLSALEKTTGDFNEAVKLASQTLRIKGRVLPITTVDTELVLKLTNGDKVKGEFNIAHSALKLEAEPELSLEPSAKMTPEGRRAIMTADMVVIAPGNLYGSLAPALLVGGVGDALQKTTATIVYVCNLVNKPKQTDDFMVHDYAREIERFARTSVLDYVVYNTAKPSPKLLEKYTHDGEYLVDYDQTALINQHYKAIGLPLIAQEPVNSKEGDKLAYVRSLIRHDAEAAAAELFKIYTES